MFTAFRLQVVTLGVLFLSGPIATGAESTPPPLEVVRIWETAGFSMPESVVVIPGHNWLYVSNVNPKAPGFVSRLAIDGAIDTLHWVDGLTDPAGMAAFDGHLYVVDQTKVHKIALETAEIIETYTAPNAVSLNDIAIGDDGSIFVSDIAGGAIFSVEGAELVKWFSAPEIPFPNGILVQDDALLVANWGDRLALDLSPEEYGALYQINIADKSITIEPATDGLGSFDGVASFYSGILASHPLQSEIYFHDDDGVTVIATVEGLPADITTDEIANRFYAPLLSGNKVIAFSLTPPN